MGSFHYTCCPIHGCKISDGFCPLIFDINKRDDLLERAGEFKRGNPHCYSCAVEGFKKILTLTTGS